MQIIKNSAIYAIVMGLKSGIGLILLPVYTVYLSTEDYGIVSIVMSMVQFLAILLLMSLNAAGMRYHYEVGEAGDARARLWGAVYYGVMINAIVLVTLVLAAHEIVLDPFVSGIPFHPFLLAGVLASLFQAGYEVYQTYLKASQAGRRSGALDLAYFVTNLSLALFLVAGLRLRAMGVILALLLTNIIFFSISHLQIRSRIAGGIGRRELRVSIRYALPLLPHALAGWLMTLVDRLFLNNMVSREEVGLYSAGFQIANVLHMLMVALNQAYGPWFFEQSTKGEPGRRRIREFSELIVLLCASLGLVFSLFSEELLRVIVTVEYQGAWVVVPFLTFAFVFRSIYYVVVGPVFLKRVRFVPLITLCGALVNIGLNYVMIGPWGKMGASFASMVTMIVTSTMALYLSVKTEKIGFRWRSMYAYVLIGMGLSLAAFLSPIVGPSVALIVKLAIVLLVATSVVGRYNGKILEVYRMLAKS